MALLDVEPNYGRWFVRVLTLGFVLRLVWVICVQVHPVSDSTVYDQLAWNIARTGAYAWKNGQLTAYWPVGTAFIYSLSYDLFGHEYGPIAVLNLLVGTVSLGLVMELARRWMSPTAAIASGSVYAVWPAQIEFTSVLASELLFNFLVLLALWAAFLVPARSKIIRGLLTGVLLAAAAYVRPTALPLPLLVGAALIWHQYSRREALTVTLAAFFAMLVCLAPWTLRNERTLGAPVLVSTNGPANLWMGNNPATSGEYMPLPPDVDGMGEVQRSNILGHRAKAFMIEHPARAATLFFRKLIMTHDRETIGISWNELSLAHAMGPRGVLVSKALSTAYWWFALALAIPGVIIVFMRERWRGFLHPSVAAWAYFALVHAVTVGADRYHLPSVPFIAMLAGLAIATVEASMARGRPERGARTFRHEPDATI